MRIKTFTKKALAMLLVAVMMIGVTAPVVSAIGPIENLIKHDDHNNDTLHYVSLGASNTNGFGHHGYLPPEVYEDPLAANKAQMNDYGYLKEPENAYPNLIKNALAEATGRDVELHQLAISSMRVEEVLYLLDDSFVPDEYMDWRFTGDDNWFTAAEAGGIPALKEAYTNYITNADVITVDLGWNNFGVYAFNNIMTILKEGGSRYWKAPAFDRVVDAGKEEEYYAIRDKVLARLNEMVDLSETALSDEVINKLVDVLAYAAFGACYNFDKVIEKIYELNPDATVVTINIQNLADELVVDLDGTQLPLGDLYGELIEFVDFYRANESPYADKYLFAYAGEDGDVDTFLDEFRLWDGDPATLSQDMKDLFDMYDDSLYTRSKIEYIMVGQVFGELFKTLRDMGALYGLSVFENDANYTYEISAFDMSWIDDIDLAKLNFNPYYDEKNDPEHNNDLRTPLELYGAAVSKHLVNLRNYEGEGKNAYNYVFENLIAALSAQKAQIEPQLAAAIVERDNLIAERDATIAQLEAAGVDSVTIEGYRSQYNNGIAQYNSGIAEAEAGIKQLEEAITTIIPTAKLGFDNGFAGLYLVYQNTLNYAYDTVGTIIQYSLQFNTFYMTPDSMANHNDKTKELLNYLVGALENNTTLKFYEELGKLGLDDSGAVAPEITVNEELFSDPVIQAVAALEVRYDFGNSFFAHPSIKGNQQIRDAVMDTLENGSHADVFAEKKINDYIDVLEALLNPYYEEKYAELKANGSIDALISMLDALEGIMDALESEVNNFDLPDDLDIDRETAKKIRDLMLEEMDNTKVTVAALRKVLATDTLSFSTSDFAKLAKLQRNLNNHLETISALAKQLGIFAEPYAMEFAALVEFYADMVADLSADAYEYLVNTVDEFKAEYLEFVELVGAYVDEVDADLGKAVRAYLINAPKDALAIICEYGKDATLKFIVDAANAGKTLYSSVSAIVAVLAQHGEEIYKEIIASEEYKSLIAEIEAKVAELVALYESLMSDPLLTAIDIDLVLAGHKADLETLYAQLIDCVVNNVEKYDSEVAELLWTALMDTAEALGIIEETGKIYVAWLDGRTDMMLGALLNSLLENSLELGDAANAVIWKYLNMLDAFIMDAAEQANAYLLAQLQALKNELAKLEEQINDALLPKFNEIKEKIEKLEALINAGVRDVKELIACIEELTAKLNALVESIKNGLNNLSFENLLKAISNLSEIKDALCTLLGDKYDELKAILNDLALDLLERAIDELKKAAPHIDKAIWDYLQNNPEEVINFFKTYGPYIEKFVNEYGDEILNVFVYILREYGEDVLAYVLENPEESLKAICDWYEKYGARILNLIMIYADVLGIDSLIAENIDMALAKLNAMLDELEAKLNALANELGIIFNNEVLPRIFELLNDVEEKLDYIKTVNGELKEYALAELNRMLDELKSLVERVINDAITGEYVVDENSFLVSITGANSEYAQLLAGALGLADKYAVMNWYEIDKELLEKADFVTIGYDNAQIHNFALTQLLGAVAAYGDGSLREQVSAFLRSVLEGNVSDEKMNEYINNVTGYIDTALEHSVLAGKKVTALDWAALVGEENVANVEALLAEVAALLEEQGITGEYVLKIDIAKILDQYGMAFAFLEEGTTFDLSIPVADFVLLTVESYLYSNMALEIMYAETIMELTAMNPNVQIAVLGQYNPLRDLTIAGVHIPLAEIGEKLSAVASARSFAFALALPNVTYVDISDVETAWDKGELEITLDMVVDYLSDPEDALFTDAGNLYVMTQILKAYGLTCKHVYDGCTDLVCNICGEARETAEHNYTSVVTKPTCTAEGYTTHTCSVCGDSYVDTKVVALGHKYDNACDADCNVCGEKRTPADHVFGDWVTIKEPTETEKGEEERKCSVCGYTEHNDIPTLPPTTPEIPGNPNLVIIVTVTVASIVALAGAFLYKKYRG
ncbi:MAG: hypothetical protein J6S23_00735 [Clostridia bacterium]|nr:hypothetical protein [Clostridia bacterium]